jgi:hypothetical protein
MKSSTAIGLLVKRKNEGKVKPKQLIHCGSYSRHGSVIECHTNGAAMMSVVLPYDALAAQFPKSRVVI